MKLFTSNKAIVSLLGVGSLVVAATVSDFRKHEPKSIAQIDDKEEIQPAERNLASLAVSKVAQMYLPMSEENIRKINTNWEITRIVGNDEKVAFDKFASPSDAKKSIKVKMELIGNGIVRINNDNEQVYRVSILSDFGTIALFKKMGNGFEILEAKKLALENNAQTLVVSEEVELVLERALNQAKSSTVLMGRDVSGHAILKDKMISELSVELRNPNGEVQHVEIDTADLMDGGSFKAEVEGEEVSGVVLNNGKDGYRITFVTGPIAGAMLNFVTKEQMEKLESTEEFQNNNDAVSVEEVKEAADKVLEERKEVADNAENMEPVEILSVDQVKDTAEQNGFSF